MTSPTQAVARKVAEVARPRAVPRPLRPWVRTVARLGLAAKAVVYLTIGVLTTRAAVGWGGRTTDSRGAMRALRHEGGALMPAFLGLGLLCYAAWRLVQAVGDTERKGSAWGGLGARALYLGSGLAHLVLAVSAFGIAAGTRARGGSLAGWVSTALSAPVGAVLVVVAGALVMVVGVAQLVKAVKDDFTEDLETTGMEDVLRLWIGRLGRFGHAARGVTFLLVGGFLARAGLHTDPGQARGIDGALRYLRAQDHGDVYLGVVAVGVVAHGLYTLAEARYRRVRLAAVR